MICDICEQESCVCEEKKSKAPKYLMSHCGTPGCFTSIKVPIGDPHTHPICKWCVEGTSHAKRGFPAVDIRLRWQKEQSA